MAEWNVDKLKEILEPLGFICTEHTWVMEKEPRSYLFKLPDVPLLEYFIVLDKNTGEMGCGDTYGGRGNYQVCNVNEIRFDLLEYAKKYIDSYHKYMSEKKDY